MRAQVSNINDKNDIYDLWKRVFSFDDNGSIDYYFEHYFQPKYCYIIKDKNTIISTLCANPHQVILNSKVVNTSMICGVLTEEKYRKKGLMRELLNFTFEELRQKELFTLIQAYNQHIYTPFEFYPTYFKKEISLHEEDICEYKKHSITNKVSTKELVDIYQKFTKNFDGYYLRDESYYEKYIGDLNAQNKKFIATKDEDKSLLGYMFYSIEQDTVFVEECVYLYYDKNILCTLLSELFKLSKNVKLKLPSDENIANIFNKKENIIVDTMVKIYDNKLFEKKFGKSNKASEFAMHFSKPLYINEYW